MPDCLFCKIIGHEIPATMIYEDERLVALQDINPQAPTHVLIIPRRHIATLNDLTPDDRDLIGAMVQRAAAIARDAGHAETGYRTVFNCNERRWTDGLPYPSAPTRWPAAELATRIERYRRRDIRSPARSGCGVTPRAIG